MQAVDSAHLVSANEVFERDLEISALKRENEALKQRLAWFERQIFGRKSEKRLLVCAEQLDLR